MTYVEVCDENEISVGSSKPFQHEGEKILVFRLEDGFYATQSKCTHLFAPLKNGAIVEGCRIKCPFHRAEFDIRTGEVGKWANFPRGIELINTIRKEKALKTYRVFIEEGKVQVDMTPAS